MTTHLPTGNTLTIATAVVVLAISSIGVAVAHEGEEGNAKDTPALSPQAKRVMATLENYATAVQSGDITQIERYVVTDDGFSSLEGAYQDLGWESYRKHLAGELPMFKDTRYSMSNIRPYVSGDLAFATMDYAMDFTILGEQFEGGEHKIAMTGKATMVLSQSNNEWKIRHMHTAREEAKQPASGSNPH